MNHSTTRSTLRRALIALATLAVVPATLALGAAPASAASLKVTDATNDVWTFNEDPESDKPWVRADGVRDGDLQQVVFAHSGKRVSITAKFVELKPTGMFALAARMRDQDGKKHEVAVESTPRHRAGKATLTKYNSEEQVRCKMRRSVNFDRNVVRVSFPRRCIGNPSSLQFTAGAFRQVKQSFYLDNPHNARAMSNVWTAKVNRG